jgi:hypothetical protein
MEHNMAAAEQTHFERLLQPTQPDEESNDMPYADRVNMPANRLLRTPLHAGGSNRLLMPSEQKVALFTQRIHQRLETRSNRSASTKLRVSATVFTMQSPSPCVDAVVPAREPKHVDASRPPLLPSSHRKANLFE